MKPEQLEIAQLCLVGEYRQHLDKDIGRPIKEIRIFFHVFLDCPLYHRQRRHAEIVARYSSSAGMKPHRKGQ
ncbi:MAG: hypothetical protein BGN91_00905 [Nitrobacter sp. 62-13]|nr:MAG: hypothetical protein BGN91_00905 [Nitrobacter sp. 62-13]